MRWERDRQLDDQLGVVSSVTVDMLSGVDDALEVDGRSMFMEKGE